MSHPSPARAVAVVLGLVWCGTAAVAQKNAPLPNATVALSVRNPKGQPLANSPIEVLPAFGFYPGNEPAPVRTQTDADGLARFSWPTGLNQVRVVARGVGHGETGTFELTEGATARPALPPLAAFGTIEGVVPRNALRPGTFVSVPGPGGRGGHRAACDEHGRFVLEDLPAGIYRLRPQAGQEALAVEARVAVAPGQRATAAFHPTEPAPAAPAPRATPPRPGSVVWAAGTVRDEAGRPVAGATVFALAGFQGGIRSIERIEWAATDAKGRWEITGPGGQSAFGGFLIAHHEGRPPAVAPLPVPPAGGDCDLVLPGRGGSLEVAVEADGKPLANVAVQITPELGDPVRGFGGRRANDPAREELDRIFYPLATTDAKGIARFEDLTPGSYQVAASTAGAGAVRGMRQGFWPGDEGRTAVARGVAIRLGETRAFRLAVAPPPGEVRVRVHGPDGKPPAERNVAMEWVHPGGGWANGRALDGDGLAVVQVGGVGLWDLRFKYLDTPIRTVPLWRAPRYEAAGVVAVSPLLEVGPVAVLTALRREPGAVLVQLRDAHGKPARGTVLLDAHYRQPTAGGSADESGTVRFAGLQAGRHELDAYLPGLTLPALGRDDDRFPEDGALVGRAALFRQECTATEDEEQTVVIRPKPVGYVRGVVRPPHGRRAADYRVWWYEADVVPNSDAHYNRDTGAFAVGPLPEGKAKILVTCRGTGPAWEDCATPEVEVRSDRVARVEVTPPAAPPAPSSAGTGWPLRARVLLPDGKTPAYGARVAHCVPGRWAPVAEGGTDALGRAQVQGPVDSGPKPARERPGSPTEPVLVAWLPGAHGAAIVPLKQATDEERKIVLPPALHVRGKVLVGGKGTKDRASRLLVVAEHEGGGILDPLLSQTVTPDADGTFELAGLTPGTYRVQAALDGIWLSWSVRLTVGPTAPEQPLTLDVGTPGRASVLRLTSRQGQPVRAVQATVERPEGPLAEALWPATFTADGAGVIHVPPLEAGMHKVRVGRATGATTLTIPPLASPRDEPVVFQVVLD
jgi:hypothetical protein